MASLYWFGRTCSLRAVFLYLLASFQQSFPAASSLRQIDEVDSALVPKSLNRDTDEVWHSYLLLSAQMPDSL
jgi:hypothetical protein